MFFVVVPWKGERGRLLPPARTFLFRCVAVSTQQNQVLTRKLATKLIQRIGMAFLPPRVAAWRYQRGKRSLMENLNKGIGSTGGVASLTNADNSKSIATAPSDDDGDFDVSVELEDVLDRVLEALSDKDTVVRWSAAKGGLHSLHCLFFTASLSALSNSLLSFHH